MNVWKEGNPNDLVLEGRASQSRLPTYSTKAKQPSTLLKLLTLCLPVRRLRASIKPSERVESAPDPCTQSQKRRVWVPETSERGCAPSIRPCLAMSKILRLVSEMTTGAFASKVGLLYFPSLQFLVACLYSLS